MTGKEYIDSIMYDCGKIQVLTTDTNLRIIILNWLNRVIKDISAQHRHWVWLEKTATFNTVSNQMSYDLPTDIDLGGHKIFSLRQKATPAKLTYFDQNKFDELEPEPDTRTGNPVYYTIFANTLKLYPVPSSIITMYIRYMRTITNLTDSATSTTDIPVKWDEVILNGVKVHAYRYFPEWGNPADQKRIYDLGIAGMKQDNDSQLDDDQYSYKHLATGDSSLTAYPFDRENVG